MPESPRRWSETQLMPLFPQILSATVLAVCFVLSMRLRQDHTTRAFQAMIALCFAWALFYGLEMDAQTLEAKTLLVKFRMMPTTFLGVVCFGLAAGMADDKRLLNRRTVVILSAFPTFLAFLCLTVGDWPYMADNLAVEQIGELAVLTYRDGPFFNLQIAYNYVLISAAIVAIFRATRHAKGIYRVQGEILAGALLFPLAVNFAYQLDLTPVDGFNFTSASFTLGCVFLLWGFLRLRLLDVRPTARDIVMEEMPDAVLVFDDRCRLIDFNGAAAAQFGLEGAGVFGTHISEVLRMMPGTIDKCRSEKTFRQELALGTRTGERVFDMSVREVPSPRQEPGRVVMLRDVTESKEAEKRLRESERRYREMIELAPFPVAITRRSDGRILLLNRMCEEQFHISRERGLQMRTADFYADPEDRTRLIVAMGSTGTVRGYEIQFKTLDGERFWAYLSTTTIEFEGQEAYFIAFSDINERRKATDALRVANTKLNMLASITRHDLLNKLTFIKGYTQLSAEIKSPEKTADYMEKMNREATAAEDIISFTRDYQDMGSLDPVWQDAGTLLGSAAGNLSMGRVSLSNGLKGVEVLADALLGKVFYNLLENALRHGQKLTEVDAYSEARGDDLVIVVRDDGVGIPEAEKERVFERGFGKNTGLGLYLVREILSLTGMTVRECGREGEGARFEITVPEGAHRKTGPKPT